MTYAAGILCLILAPLNLLLAPPTPAPMAALLLLATLALEATAVPLANFGYFRATFATVLALSLVPEGGAGAATAAALLALLVHRGSREDGLAFALPTLSAVLVSHWQPLAAPLVYLLLDETVSRQLAATLPRPELLVWLRLKRVTRPLRVVVALAGLGVGAALQQQGWHLLWLWPLLWVCHRAAESTLFLDQARVAQSARHQLTEAHSDLQRSEAEARELAGERNLLLQLSASLAGVREPAEVARLVIEAARQTAPLRSAVLFLSGPEGLVPFRHHSPEREKLEAAELMKWNEPVVMKCWEEKRTVGSTPELRRGQRLFEKENEAAAVYLPGQGVLYVGTPEHPLSKDVLNTLTLICGQASSALEAARHFEAQQKALELHRQAHHELENWVTRLEQLLSGARALSSTLEQRLLLEHFRGTVEVLVPHKNGLVLERGEGWRKLAGWGRDFGDQLDELAGWVLEQGKPLLLPRVAESRFKGCLPEGHVGLLAAPLEALEGVVVLTSEGTEMTRQHQDLLFTLGTQLALAVSNSRSFAALATAQAQLMQSAKMAAVGQLAAGVAHEMNSPLATVRLALEALPSDLPERTARRMERARRAVERANFIIDRLLDFSRTPSGEGRPVDLNEVVSQTLDFMMPQLERDEFVLETELEARAAVRSDPRELQQVLINLLLNAREACLEGERRLKVFTSQEDGTVCLGVEDRGRGMSEAELEKVFEPFYTTRAEGGTGLGLAISLEIAEKWGGSLTLQSVKGEGTRALLSMPLDNAH